MDIDNRHGPKSGELLCPHFRPMSVVAKRSPISATAELLLQLLWAAETCRTPISCLGLWRFTSIAIFEHRYLQGSVMMQLRLIESFPRCSDWLKIVIFVSPSFAVSGGGTRELQKVSSAIKFRRVPRQPYVVLCLIVCWLVLTQYQRV